MLLLLLVLRLVLAQGPSGVGFFFFFGNSIVPTVQKVELIWMNNKNNLKKKIRSSLAHLYLNTCKDSV